MKTVLLTGGIGSGKSAVADFLKRRGVPVYDSDSAAKRLYSPELIGALEREFGCSIHLDDGSLDRKALSDIIFNDEGALKRLEALLYPRLIEDFVSWRQSKGGPFVVFESAIALSKPMLHGLWDAVVAVEAPVEERLKRAMARDGATRDAVLERMAAQEQPFTADAIIDNSGSLDQLESAAERIFFSENAYICKLINQ